MTGLDNTNDILYKNTAFQALITFLFVEFSLTFREKMPCLRKDIAKIHKTKPKSLMAAFYFFQTV